MDDKEFEKQRERVLAIFNSWRDLLSLNSHRFSISYDRNNDNDKTTVARVWANWEYMTHHVKFYMPQVLEIEEDDQLEELVVHELVHVLLDPLSKQLKEDGDEAKLAINEFVTTNIAYRLIWARDKSKEKE